MSNHHTDGTIGRAKSSILLLVAGWVLLFTQSGCDTLRLGGDSKPENNPPEIIKFQGPDTVQVDTPVLYSWNTVDVDNDKKTAFLIFNGDSTNVDGEGEREVSFPEIGRDSIKFTVSDG